MILNDTPMQLLTQHVQVPSNLNINPPSNMGQLLLSNVSENWRLKHYFNLKVEIFLMIYLALKLQTLQVLNSETP